MLGLKCKVVRGIFTIAETAANRLAKSGDKRKTEKVAPLLIFTEVPFKSMVGDERVIFVSPLMSVVKPFINIS